MTCNLIEKEKFDALSNSEKRVAIANDVIARMNANKIFSQKGALISKSDVIGESDLNIQDFFNEKPCFVCAKGALVCSWVGNFNHYQKLDVINFDMDLRYEQPKYPVELVEIFGREMLDNIELAFEQELYTWHINYLDLLNGSFDEDWESPYYEDIQAIMENIIENNGEFIPQ